MFLSFLGTDAPLEFLMETLVCVVRCVVENTNVHRGTCGSQGTAWKSLVSGKYREGKIAWKVFKSLRLVPFYEMWLPTFF